MQHIENLFWLLSSEFDSYLTQESKLSSWASWIQITFKLLLGSVPHKTLRGPHSTLSPTILRGTSNLICTPWNLFHVQNHKVLKILHASADQNTMTGIYVTTDSDILLYVCYPQHMTCRSMHHKRQVSHMGFKGPCSFQRNGSQRVFQVWTWQVQFILGPVQDERISSSWP